MRPQACTGRGIAQRLCAAVSEEERSALLTASTRQTLLENVMKKHDAARDAISAELKLILPDVVVGYAESAKQAVFNATAHLRVDLDGSDTSDGEGFAYKNEEIVGLTPSLPSSSSFTRSLACLPRMRHRRL